jgi:hypothetical protein
VYSRALVATLKNFITTPSSRKVWLILVTELSLGTFTLVDSAGEVTERGKLGLLLYNRGTICEGWTFDNNAADAICHSMG